MVEYPADGTSDKNLGNFNRKGFMQRQTSVVILEGNAYYGETHAELVKAKAENKFVVSIGAGMYIVEKKGSFLAQCNNYAGKYPDSKKRVKNLNAIKWKLFENGCNYGCGEFIRNTYGAFSMHHSSYYFVDAYSYNSFCYRVRRKWV
jgi:hypothetical protein